MSAARSLGHRAPLLWVLLPLMAGLIAARVTSPPPLGLVLGLALGGAVVALWAAFQRETWWGPAIAAAALLTGIASYGLHRQRLVAWENLPPREARVVVRVDRLFAQTDPRRATGLGSIVRSDGIAGDLAGQRIYFSASQRPTDPRPQRSSVMVLSGVITPLSANAPSGSFDGYLATAGVNFRLTRARIVAEERPARAYYRFCDSAAQRFKAILGQGIADKRPTLAGLLRAMMLGETRELTEDQHTIFMQSGTMHLFAISGLNIAVIAGAFEAILRLLRLPSTARFAIGTPLLWLFVDITGGTPSAVRAFAMATFFRVAFVARRPANTLASIVGSAAIVLVLSPLQLFSASFLMSYGIVAVLLMLGLPLSETWATHTALWQGLPKPTWSRWQRVTDVSWRYLVLALAIGVATTLVSLLTSVEFFHLLTPGALFANLVLIPAAMLVTLGGFASLLCGLVGFTAGAALCNHAAALCLLVIEALVRQSVHVPGAFHAAQFRATWVGPVALIAVLTAVIVGYAARWKLACGGWWPPFAIVAIALLAGVRFA